jgi:glycosyltransferase involved in cell wall biosynthesis
MTAFLQDADYAWRNPLRRRLFSTATRIGFNAADAVVATSQGVADDLDHGFGVRTRHLTVIPNPVDLDAVSRRSIESLDRAVTAQWTDRTIVAAGRLADAKNYPLLIEAMGLVRQRVAARLVILGHGERETALRTLVGALGLNDVVEFAGFQENPWKFIARSAVFVLTSRYEGFGNVLVEALACGVPVVATASAGTRDIVRHEIDGLLIEQHSPQAVADALVRVLADGTLRARLAENARAGAHRFSLAQVSARYDDLFKGLAA